MIEMKKQINISLETAGYILIAFGIFGIVLVNLVWQLQKTGAL